MKGLTPVGSKSLFWQTRPANMSHLAAAKINITSVNWKSLERAKNDSGLCSNIPEVWNSSSKHCRHVWQRVVNCLTHLTGFWCAYKFIWCTFNLVWTRKSCIFSSETSCTGKSNVRLLFHVHVYQQNWIAYIRNGHSILFLQSWILCSSKRA